MSKDQQPDENTQPEDVQQDAQAAEAADAAEERTAEQDSAAAQDVDGEQAEGDALSQAEKILDEAGTDAEGAAQAPAGSDREAELEADLRLARNLAALTPFQRATRDRVQAAAQATAKRAMQARLDVERLVCHRDVLAADLAAEERHWRQTKRLALRAATQKLASECEEEEAAAQRERAREEAVVATKPK